MREEKTQIVFCEFCQLDPGHNSEYANECLFLYRDCLDRHAGSQLRVVVLRGGNRWSGKTHLHSIPFLSFCIYTKGIISTDT